MMMRRRAERMLLATAALVWATAAVVAAACGGVTSASTAPTSAPELIWPEANSYVSQPFGPSNHSIEPAVGPYLHFHTGIDFVAAVGAPVLAAASGKVVFVSQQRQAGVEVGYGNFVIVAHDQHWATVYAHLETAPPVHVGDLVVRGQRIGSEGSTGNSTGPHLHFELRLDGKAVDPAPYLYPHL